MPQLTVRVTRPASHPCAVTGIGHRGGAGPGRPSRCVLARTAPRESNIYARIGNHPICSGLSCVPTFSLIPTPAGGRTGAAGCILASGHLRLRGGRASGVCAAAARGRPQNATANATEHRTGTAWTASRDATHAPRSHPTLPESPTRARVLSEARLCHAPILTMIRTACAKVKPPSAPTSAPTRLASSLSRPTFLRATPTPRSDGADVDGAVGPERCCEQARARHRALVGTYDLRSWPK